MAKDKFAQMKKGGGVGSFQEAIVQTAATVAAIERKKEEQTAHQQSVGVSPASPAGAASPVVNPQEQPRFMRLPNPQIPLNEYNLVSTYCNTFANMTRQDFVELAIIEKLHNDGQLSDDDFITRQTEIRSRPPRGQRKGTKQTSK